MIPLEVKEMDGIVYLRMKKKLEIMNPMEVKLKDVAYISSYLKETIQELQDLRIYRITEKDKEIVIIDSFLIIKHLTENYPNLEIQLVGPEQTIIRVSKYRKNPNILIVVLVWLLLFIGTAMTIINFSL